MNHYYRVTCSPVGPKAWNEDERQVEVYAASGSEAIKQVRREYREENGRFATTYAYRACRL